MAERELQQAAASFILTFYQEVQGLKDIYARYSNTVFYIGAKTGIANAEAMQPEEKNELLNLSQGLRYAIKICWVDYRAICKSLNKTINQEIENAVKLLDKIEEEDKVLLLVNPLPAEDFLSNLLVFLTSDLATLTVSAESLVNEVYKK